jgi:hypothetical protein
MRFMVRIQDNPDLENFNDPLGLFRFQVTTEQIVTDRFDVQREMWIDWPSMIGFTGIGGADDFIEINENEANQLIERWLDEKGTEEEEGEQPEGEVPETEDEPETPLGERGFQLFGSLRRLAEKEEDEEGDEDDEEDY